MGRGKIVMVKNMYTLQSTFTNTIDLRNILTEEVEGIITKTELDIPKNENDNHLLISKGCISERVKAIADDMLHDYIQSKKKNETIYLIQVLEGARPFAADLALYMTKKIGPLILDHVTLKSYKDNISTGEIRIEKDCCDIRGKNVHIIEDLVDTGRTMSWLVNYLLKEKGANSVKICCLLDKRDARLPEFSNLKIDYTGFIIPNLYVFGYGMDTGNKMRELKSIYYKK